MASDNWIKTTCLLCGTNENTRLKFKQNFSEAHLTGDIFSARRTTEHYHYTMLECRKCGFVFSSPILPYEKISELYKISKQNYDKEVDYISQTYVSYIKNNLSLFKNKNNALDIGCGSGFFLTELQKAGYKNVYGVEPSEEAVSKAGMMKEKIFNGFFEHAAYEADSFDLITCFQTLDHLMNPKNILERIFNLLKKGGIAYFIVHNEKGMQAKIFGEKSPIYDVEHIYLFNKNTLARLSEKTGFSVLKIFDVKNSYPLSYWIRMAPIPFKNQVTAVAKLTGLSNRTLSIYPGNIGIFIQKPI